MLFSAQISEVLHLSSVLEGAISGVGTGVYLLFCRQVITVSGMTISGFVIPEKDTWS